MIFIIYFMYIRTSHFRELIFDFFMRSYIFFTVQKQSGFGILIVSIIFAKKSILDTLESFSIIWMWLSVGSQSYGL